jgi:hypothetical protein
MTIKGFRRCFICGKRHSPPHFKVKRQWKDVVVRVGDGQQAAEQADW